MQRQLFLRILALALLLVGCRSNSTPPTAEEGPQAGTPVPASPAADSTVTGATKGYPAPGSAGSGSAYPAPSGLITPTALPSGYPAPAEVQFVPTTAEEAFPIAATEAKEWNEEGIFVGIVPSLQMLRNLNIPPIRGGWFFKFILEGNPDEYFVLVIENTVHGSTVAQPILVEPLPYKEEAVDLSQLKISSAAFQEQFFASEAGAPYVGRELEVDYRLVDLDSTPNPVWSALDAESGEELFHIDAVTGDEVEAPFSQYFE